VSARKSSTTLDAPDEARSFYVLRAVQRNLEELSEAFWDELLSIIDVASSPTGRAPARRIEARGE